MTLLNDILTKINDVMYTYILVVLLVGVGIYFTIRTKGVQFRLLLDGIKSMMEKSEKTENGEKKVSSFQATINDLTPNVLLWLKEKKLTSKLRIRF